MLLATGSSDGVVRIIDVFGGEIVTQVDHAGGPVRAVAWSPSETLLATGTGGHNMVPKARVVDVASGITQLEVTHAGFVRALAWDADGRQLATGSDDGVLRIVDVSEGRVEREEALGGFVRAVAWSF